MDIQKEQDSFKKTMLNQNGEYDEEHFELDSYGNFSWIGTDDHFEIWMLCSKAKQAEIDELKGKLAKAQADQKVKLLLCDEHLKKCESPTGIFNSQYPDEEPCLICLAKEAKAQSVPEGFILVKINDLELLRDSALEIKYASLNNDSDRIFSDIEDIQLSVERLIEAQEQNQ